MQIKKIFLITLFIFLFISVNKVFAFDMFPTLEKLTVGQSMPEDVLSVGIEKKNNDTLFLEYESHSPSYPHYVELNKSKEIIYIELKIPETHIEYYKSVLSELGKPESIEEQSPSNVLLAYPSKGLGFITSRRNENFLIQTKFPPKTVVELKKNEAKNFEGVSMIEAFPSGIIQPEPTKAEIPKDLQIQQAYEKIENRKKLLTYATIFFSILFLIWVVMGIKLYLKNKKQKQQEKQSLVNFSDNIRLPNQRDKV